MRLTEWCVLECGVTVSFEHTNERKFKSQCSAKLGFEVGNPSFCPFFCGFARNWRFPFLLQVSPTSGADADDASREYPSSGINQPLSWVYRGALRHSRGCRVFSSRIRMKKSNTLVSCCIILLNMPVLDIIYVTRNREIMEECWYKLVVVGLKGA